MSVMVQLVVMIIVVVVVMVIVVMMIVVIMMVVSANGRAGLFSMPCQVIFSSKPGVTGGANMFPQA